MNFSSNSITINTTATTAGQSGGNVNIVAFKGATAGTGNVTFAAGSTITTGGDTTGANGSVKIIAGGTSSPFALVAPQINTTGGSGGGGNVTLVTATPVLSSVTVGSNGTLSSAPTVGSLVAGNIELNGSVNGAIVTIAAGGVGTITQTGGTVTGTTSISLSSGSGSIGSINTSTPSLTLNTTGAATVVNSGYALSLASGGSTFGSLSVSNATSITTTTALASSAALSLLVTGLNGGVTLGNSASGTVVTLTVKARRDCTDCRNFDGNDIDIT